MAVERLLPNDDARDLLQLTRDIADKVLDPIVDEHEKAETYPDGVFATLGEAGLLSLPYPEEWGGGGQSYEVYLQVLEELASRWAAVHGPIRPMRSPSAPMSRHREPIRSQSARPEAPIRWRASPRRRARRRRAARRAS